MLCIVQARMSSRRLPGKMLRDIAGRTLLQHVVDRVGAATSVSRVVVATSAEKDDDGIAEYCAAHSIACRRGPLDDVAERFRQVVAAEGADAFVRVTGDSALIDPQLIDHAVALFECGRADLATNVFVRTFPVGQSVEVLDAATFARVCTRLPAGAQREHITQAYYADPARFRIVSFTSGSDYGAVNLSVDTADDFDRVSAVLARGPAGSWRELVEQVAPR